MKTISNTLKVIMGRWDDPGDYPNNVAAGPLPSYDYIEDVEGELILELTDVELYEFENDRDFFVDENVLCELDHVTILKWDCVRDRNEITLTCERFEPC